MTIKTQGPEVSVAGKDRSWSEEINPDSVIRQPLSGRVPVVGSTGSSAEEDPISVKVKYTLQQHFKAALH